MALNTKVVKWVVFYDNGEKYTSNVFEPKDVPIDGVQWIVEFMENGSRRNVHGMDNYMWTGDSWAGGNDADLKGWLRTRDRIPIILYGRWTSDAQYAKTAKLVEECCDG